MQLNQVRKDQTMKKKILFVNFQSCYGGGEIYLENVINGVNESGEFTIYTLTPKNEKFIQNISKSSQIIIGLARYKKFISFRNVKRYLSEAKFINKIVDSKKIDIVFLNGKEGLYLAPLIRKKVKKVAVNHVIGIDKPAIRLKKFLNKNSVKHINRLILISEKAKKRFIEEIGEKYNQKLTVIYNGIDIDKFKNAREFKKDKNSKIVIMEIARLQRFKGHKELINSFNELHKDFPNTELMIVGEGEERQNIERQIKELKLEDNVILTGFVSTEKIIKKGDVIVLPSYYENFPLILLEAMAASRSIVSTTAGGIPEIVTDNETGFIVNPGDEKALYEKLKILLEDEDKRKIFGKNGYEKVVEKFSLEKMISSLIQVFHEVCP